MKTLFSFLFLLWVLTIQAQDKYWVYFKDKPDTNTCHLTPRCLTRRALAKFPERVLADRSVAPQYQATVALLCDSVGHSSRWLNAMAVYASPNQLSDVIALPFVSAVSPMQQNGSVCNRPEEANMHEGNVLQAQTSIMEGEKFSASGVRGQGVLIAIFDAGFRNAHIHPGLQHLFEAKRIKATYDFVRKDPFVYGYDQHGTSVWSCIAGKYEDKPMGLAGESAFILARTERSKWEGAREEDHWVAALEWAESLGVDIVNSSLGYTNRRYFKTDMDGLHSPVSRVANMAIQRGVLVVNAAGNDGLEEWEIIGAPADADSVLTVGAITPWTGLHSEFSSYGPTADNRMKPNLVAFGYAMVAVSDGLAEQSGTSFSAPLVSGFAACVKTMHPDWTGKELFGALQQAGSLYPYFDYAHGYGVPKAGFFTQEVKEASPDYFDMQHKGAFLKISWRPESGVNADSKKEEQLALMADYARTPHFLYYHIVQDGIVRYYAVLVPDPEGNEIPLPASKCQIVLHYKGNTRHYELD